MRRPLKKALVLAACLTVLVLPAACATPPAAAGSAPASVAPAADYRLATLQPEEPAPLETEGAAEETVTMSFTGLASWYGKRFHGRRTASGERYDMTAFTAAHPNLPFGSRVRVTNLANDRSVVVIVNDRGPFVKTRLIDVSHAAAKQLGILEDGVAEVRVDVLADAAG